MAKPAGILFFVHGANETSEGLVENVARAYWRHFSVPMTISEIATSGSIARRAAWLARSVDAVRTVRAEGIPLAGYTWWPMFALVTWAWRQGWRDVASHLLQMGLWDLDTELNRIHTPLVDAYRALAGSSSDSAGPLA